MQGYLIAAGLVVVAMIGLVVIWKVTKSLVRLLFWFVALLAVAIAAWWLLGKFGILAPPPFIPI
ncbi:MAG TPA: hypothetical protein DCE44_00480 [Verrucomicrobiales bacterium]|nr:hypothetical protein [Verrucomicrobiales bacterium]